MSGRKKRALGRGMADLVEGSFSSIVEPPAPAMTARAVHPAAEPASAARPFDVVSVSSGKGGTGKSVLACNLGAILAATTRVTILDADLGLANIHILYNMTPRYNASHLISGERRVEEVLVRGPRGVNVIPGGSGIPDLTNLSAARFGALVDGIASLDRVTDLLIIDTPSGIDRQSLLFLLASDHVLVVTTGDVTSMTDAYAVIKAIFARRPDASALLVVNQAGSEASGLETYRKVAHVTRKFLSRELELGGIIPFDERVESSIAERVPVALSHPDSPAARAMISIAARLGPRAAAPSSSRQPFATRLRVLLSGLAN
ncbi:MAG TPA: MinD/ParA family protein [Candidatus Polarisedimenticolia bacterium]|jgi:flagellar biosynthesis protein FlhG